MKLFWRLFLLSCAGLSGAALAATDQASQEPLRLSGTNERLSVRHNPFARPLTPSAVVGVRPKAIETAVPQLKGVLNAGADSFANLNGHIIGLGESYGDLRLESVRDDGATFSRGGRSLSLRVAASPDRPTGARDANAIDPDTATPQRARAVPASAASSEEGNQ